MGKQARLNLLYKNRQRNSKEFQENLQTIEKELRLLEVCLFDRSKTDTELDRDLMALLERAENYYIAVYTSANQRLTRRRDLELGRIMLNFSITSEGIRHDEEELHRIVSCKREYGVELDRESIVLKIVAQAVEE